MDGSVTAGADPLALSAHVEAGRSIGYAYAELRLKPPEDAGEAIREGHAEAVFMGVKGRSSGPFERKHLRLRLSAWRRWRTLDEKLTPEFLERIWPTHCPITRDLLTSGTGGDTDGTVDRVFNGAGYAVGNVAFMSARANHAKGSMSVAEVWQVAKEGKDWKGLGAQEWMRLACLTSMAAPPGERVHHLPMLVYPPVGLFVNGMVVLQQALTLAGCNLMDQKEVGVLRASARGKQAKRALEEAFVAIAGQAMNLPKLTSCVAQRAFDLADCWEAPLVQKRYLGLLKATEGHAREELMDGAFRAVTSVRAMGFESLGAWRLETGGYE